MLRTLTKWLFHGGRQWSTVLPFGLNPPAFFFKPMSPLWVPVRPSQDSRVASPAAHLSSEGHCYSTAIGQRPWFCSSSMVHRSNIRLISNHCTCSGLFSHSISLFACLSGISAETEHIFPSTSLFWYSRALGLNKSSCHSAKGTARTAAG